MTLSFATLWANHPTTKGEDNPCRDKKGQPNFENQCAIRLGIALADSGLNMKSYAGARCWFGHKGHCLRVEEMVKWLRTQSHQVGSAQVFKGNKPANGEQALTAVNGKTGIAACLNFWGQGNQGDHIDLWDGTTLRKGDSSYFLRSGEIYFWAIA